MQGTLLKILLEDKRISAAIQAEECEDYNAALKLYEEALSDFKTNQWTKGVIFVYDSMGYIFECMDQLDEAVECYKSALVLKEKINDKNGEGRSYISLGIIHRHKGEILKAEECLEHAYSTLKGSDDNYTFYICTLYFTEVALELKKYKLAKRLLEEIEEDIRKSEDVILVVSFNLTVSTYLFEAKDEKLLSLQRAEEAIRLADEFDDKFTLATALIHYGGLLSKLGRFLGASDNLKTSLELLDSYPSNNVNYLKNKAEQLMNEIKMRLSE